MPLRKDFLLERAFIWAAKGTAAVPGRGGSAGEEGTHGEVARKQE